MGNRWRAALGLVVAAAALYWALHNVVWHDFFGALRTSNVALWLAAMVVAQLIFPLRARRWKPMLAPIAPDLRFNLLWRATAIGMMVNNVTGRAGELARAYVLSRDEPRVPFAAALASLVVDRTFDALVVLLLLLVALLDPHFRSGVSMEGWTVSALVIGSTTVIVGAVVVLYLCVFAPQRVESIVGGVARRVIPGWRERVVLMTRSFVGGLRVLRNPRLLAAVFAWTVAHWLVHATAMWLGFRALGIHVPLTAALLVQGLIAMGAAVVPTPGFVGIFEKAGTAGLGLYGVSVSVAGAWALCYHLLTMIPITLIGLWYAGRLGLSLGQLRHTSKADQVP
jgi:hypothetical protein